MRSPRVLRLGILTISVGTTTPDEASGSWTPWRRRAGNDSVFEKPIFSPGVEQFLTRALRARRLFLPGEDDCPIV